MAAVSVKELIGQKEAIEKRKKQQYNLETSIGTITVRQPSRALAADAIAMDDGASYITAECAGADLMTTDEIVEIIRENQCKR